MQKPNLMDETMSELISNRDISDESIYVVYQFLSNLVLEFESHALGRLRRYSREQEKMREEMADRKNGS